MRLLRRDTDREDAEAVRREMWARVLVRNGCVPSQAKRVEEPDSGGPMAVVALVFLVLLGALAFGVYALGHHFGWIGALVALVGAAFAPVGRRS